MFDKITITTPPLTDDKINCIVLRNGLQTNSRDGVVCYDNRETKNLIQQRGIYIEIGTNKRLKAEGSLQKFYNELFNGSRHNYNLFTMKEAQTAIKNLLHEKGIHPTDAYIFHYEIGLNIEVSTDCRNYLNKIQSIGAAGGERLVYVNPKYKDERVKTTIFHKHTRKYFKVYDKVFEMRDKKQKNIPDTHILRIETAYRRLSNCTLEKFFAPGNLYKLIETFFKDWQGIHFEQKIMTPKGTGRAKQHLCVQILDKGRDEVLRESKENHSLGVLTDKEYRNIREFITKEWDEFKDHISFIQSPEEVEFRKWLHINHTILKHDLLGEPLK